MTKLLEQAFPEAAKLSELDQDTLAQRMLQEIASERRWDKIFVRSSDRLAELAEEALTEHRERRTQEMNG